MHRLPSPNEPPANWEEIDKSIQSSGVTQAEQDARLDALELPINGMSLDNDPLAASGVVVSDFYQDGGNFQMQLRSTINEVTLFKATIPNVEFADIPDLQRNLFTLVTTDNGDGTYDHTFTGWLLAFGRIRILGGVVDGVGLGNGAQAQLVITGRSAFEQ